MKLLRDRIFASVALGHFMVDLLNGTRATLLAFLSVPLGLTNTTLGLISSIYQFASAFAQPLFGYFCDRIGSRWVVAGGVLWMGVFFTLGLTIQGPLALVFLVLASAGSGAFHPAGAAQATMQGRDRMAGRETTAASYFFVFGQIGFFFGPLIAGPLLDRWGLTAMIPLSLLCFPMGSIAAWNLRFIRPQPRSEKATAETKTPVKIHVWMLIALALIASFQSAAQQIVITYVPKYLVDLGQNASTYGMFSAFFMGGSGLGNVLGGTLADRIGKKRVIFLAMTMGSLPLFFIGRFGASFWLLLLVVLSGLLNGAAYSVIVVLAQKTIPVGMGLASGLILGFNFGCGSLGMLLGGIIADHTGFTTVFSLASLGALCGGLLALTLNKEAAPDKARLPVEIEGD